MRLTAELLLHAEQRFNPLLERELIVRGFKVTAIENLAVVQDQFDVIDFSDNEIKKVENFPTMKRLSCLVFNNNLVSRISATLGEQLPSMRQLVLTNNRVASLCEVDHIASFRGLEHLSLLENPVSFNVHYRLYVIHSIPSLKSLDFRKVQRKEREAAAALFSSPLGRTVKETIAEEAKAQADGTRAKPAVSLTEDQKRQVRLAIEGARTKQDIDLIEHQLKTGTFVFITSVEAGSSSSGSGSSNSSSSGGADGGNGSSGGDSLGNSSAGAVMPPPPPPPPMPVAAASGRIQEDGDDDDDVDMS